MLCAPRSLLRRLKVTSIQGVYVKKTQSAGRGLFSSENAGIGDVLLAEAGPLVWCAPASLLGSVCEACLRELPNNSVSCPGCRSSYCGEACKKKHWEESGHSVLCGGTHELDAWSLQEGYNFPRMAAYALAKSLCGGVEFSEYWGKLNGLSYATPPPLEEQPRAFKEGYVKVRDAFLASGRVSGKGVTQFFDSVFNQAAYARLMGTLRLNTFSVDCPLGSAKVFVETPRRMRGEIRERDVSSDCCSSNDCGAEGTREASSTSCADSPAALGDAPGGAALYEVASLANHECEPTADVLISPGGGLALRARIPLAVGEQITISYLDSSLPYALRNRKLFMGYGFKCECSRCKQGI